MRGILHQKVENPTQVYEMDFFDPYISLLGLAMLKADAVSDISDRKLHEAGGEELLLTRMSDRQRRLWSNSAMSLDAFTLENRYNYGNAPIVLAAMRETPSGELGRIGVYTVVGYRLNGSNVNATPLDCPIELGYTANAMAAWRESLHEEDSTSTVLSV